MKYGSDLLCDPKELDKLDPARTAHLCIDVQDFYFKDKGREAETVAGRIAAIAPAFGRAGLRKEFYIYHMDKGPQFFIVDPAEQDILPKVNFSAFDGTGLNTALKEMGIESLILSGGYAFDCLGATAQDALERGYNVFVLENCIYDPVDPEDALMLKNAFRHHSRYDVPKQALFTTTAAVLQRFREQDQSKPVSRLCPK